MKTRAERNEEKWQAIRDKLESESLALAYAEETRKRVLEKFKRLKAKKDRPSRADRRKRRKEFQKAESK